MKKIINTSIGGLSLRESYAQTREKKAPMGTFDTEGTPS